jgi:pimeloyl-ACP methyl ester carboxylesterase
MRRFLRCLRIPDPLSSWILRYVEWIIGQHEKIAPINTARQVECPLLLVHGEHDATVPVSDAWATEAHCKNKTVRLLLIEDADHNSARKLEEHGEQLIAFLIRAGIAVSNSKLRQFMMDGIFIESACHLPLWALVIPTTLANGRRRV